MRNIVVCMMLVSAFSIGSARAQEYTAIGAGADSCGTWTANRSSPNGNERIAGDQWVLGFLSGIGFMGDMTIDPLNGMDAQGVWAWIDNYCRANPIDEIADAAGKFYLAHPR